MVGAGHARGPRARPARRRCGSRRPRASAPPAGTPRRAARLRRNARWRRAARLRRRSSCRSSASRPRGRAGGQSLEDACSSCSVSSLAELDEVRPRDRDRLLRRRRRAASNVGVVRERGIAADAEVVLHAALGGQAVVVPAHRVEDLVARACAGSGRRCRCGCSENTWPTCSEPLTVGGGVSIEKTCSRVFGAVEAVGALALPAVAPALLDAVERRLLRDARS